MRYKLQPTAKNEDGIVALFVVGIMIILLSLTTVAFTKLMGREARQSLDRELSTQAYYAAQSGLNDAKDYLGTHPGANLTSSSCDTLSSKGYPTYLGPSTTDVNRVTCVVADTAPEQLYFQIPTGKSRIFEMSSPNAFGSLLFSWDNANATGYNLNNYKSGGAGTKRFTPTTTWNNTSNAAPVLEVTYYPMPNSGQSVSNLLSYGRTIFLYPSGIRANGASTYNSSQADGLIVNNSCQSQVSLPLTTFKNAGTVYHCNTVVTPTIVPGGGATNHIFVKVSSFYGPASLQVRANTAAGNTIAIQGAQAILDSTGKGGSDVLKRLQTVIDYRPTNIEPGNTLETVMGLCKRLEYNLTLQTPQVNDPAPTDAATSPACSID